MLKKSPSNTNTSPSTDCEISVVNVFESESLENNIIIKPVPTPSSSMNTSNELQVQNLESLGDSIDEDDKLVTKATICTDDQGSVEYPSFRPDLQTSSDTMDVQDNEANIVSDAAAIPIKLETVDGRLRRSFRMLVMEHETHEVPKIQATVFDMFWLGVCCIAVGPLLVWSYVFAFGFWNFAFALLIVCFGYWSLTLCLAEMASALPFNGGMYGFIRLTFGSYLGYLVGCSEALMNILTVATVAQTFGPMCTEMFELPKSLEPVFWTIAYAILVFVCLSGGNIFWTFARVMGVLYLLLLAMYVFGTAQYVDFDTYVSKSIYGGGLEFSKFIEVFPNACWFFMGIEGLPLAGSVMKDPQNTLAKSMIGCMVVFTIIACIIPFFVTSQAPGIVDIIETYCPLSPGYSRMFQIPVTRTYVLAFPGTIGTAFGYMFVATKQLVAMSKSGLLPEWLGKTDKRFSYAPSWAYITVAFLCIALSLMTISENISLYFLQDLMSVPLLGSAVVYIASFTAYIVFRKKLDNGNVPFRNPLGITGAAIGLFIFVVSLTSILALQDNSLNVSMMFIGYLFICTLFYCFYSSKNLHLSDEEQSALFNAYVMKANLAKRFKKKKVAPSVASENSSKPSNRSHQRTSVSVNSTLPTVSE